MLYYTRGTHTRSPDDLQQVISGIIMDVSLAYHGMDQPPDELKSAQAKNLRAENTSTFIGKLTGIDCGL